MPTLHLSGRPYFYEDRGSGVPLLLLHGFPFTSESFWPQLEAPPAGVRVIAPDHRGFGRSGPAEGSSTMEAMAEDGLALLDALGVRAALVGGVSMGGYVSIALARLDPGRVLGLLLVDTQSLPDDEATRQRREATAQEVERSGLDAMVDGMLPRLFAAGAAPAVRARVERIMRAQAPAAVAAAQRGMARRTDGKDLLSRFAGPCAVVVGAEDVITPVERARVMQGLVEGATLDVVEGAGHLVNLERPEAFAGVVTRLASSVRATAGR